MVRSWRRWTAGAMAVGATTVILGSLLPWLSAGARDRNSYDLLELVERLGYAEDGPAGLALRWWPLVPLLVVVAVGATAWRPRLPVGGIVGIAAGLYAGGTAVAVIVAVPSSRLVDLRPGAVVTAAGAVILLAGAVLALVNRR